MSVTNENNKNTQNDSNKKTLRHQMQKYLFITIGFCLLISIVLIFPRIIPKEEPNVTTISKSTLINLIETSDLSTLDYTYNAIATVTDEKTAAVKYHVAYEGTVTAGIDFSKIDLSIDKNANRISIRIPDAEIQYIDVDMGTLDFIFEKKKYDTETVSLEAYRASLADLEQRAKKENSLLSMAKENAVNAITALITPWAQAINDSYIVEVQ